MNYTIKMKTFFVLCAVLSVAFANAMPDSKDSEFEVLDLFKAKKSDFPFTDEQVQCLEDRVDEGAAANPELREWITNTKKTGFELLERARGCYEKTGLRRKFCLAKLTVSALKFYRKINKQLPKEHKAAMGALKGIVKECLGIKIPIF